MSRKGRGSRRGWTGSWNNYRGRIRTPADRAHRRVYKGIITIGACVDLYATGKRREAAIARGEMATKRKGSGKASKKRIAQKNRGAR